MPSYSVDINKLKLSLQDASAAQIESLPGPICNLLHNVIKSMETFALGEQDEAVVVEKLDIFLKSGVDQQLKAIARCLLVQISSTTNSCPTSLLIEGCQQRGNECFSHGRFSDLYLSDLFGQSVVLKVQRSDGTKLKRLYREGVLLNSLNHSNIITVCGIDASLMAIAFPLMVPLMEHLHNSPSVDPVVIISELAQALDYLHSCDIVHGNVIGSNILINGAGHVQLAGFGSAHFVHEDSQFQGSARSAAPELLDPSEFRLTSPKTTSASDTFTFSFTCSEIFTRKIPFSQYKDVAIIMVKILNGQRPYLPPLNTPPMSEIKGIIIQCWAHQPSERLTMNQVVGRLSQL